MSELQSSAASPNAVSNGDNGERKPTIFIRPRRGWAAIPFAEMWQYRDLLWLFTTRDVRVRYKQSVLGALWAIIQPITRMIVFTVFFGKLMGVEGRLGEFMNREVPYPVFVLSGQVLWQFFATCVTTSANSVVAQSNLVKKVYFPRLLLPISSCGAPLVDMVIAFGVLLLMMLYYWQPFSIQLLLVPLFFLSVVISALGVGLLMASLIVSYRDFRHVMGFMVQTWFFITPVIMPLDFVPEQWNGIPVRQLLYLNPMAGTIDAFRAAVLSVPIDYGNWALSMSVSIVAMTLGMFFFTRAERQFADVA